MAPPLTPEGKLQILKWFIDSNKSRFEVGVAEWMKSQPEIFPQTIEKIEQIEKQTWEDALQYAEQRIEPVETERNLLLKRNKELKGMDKRNSDHNLPTPDVREKDSRRLAGRSKEEVIAMVQRAMAALCRVKEEREESERELAKRLKKVIE